MAWLVLMDGVRSGIVSEPVGRCKDQFAGLAGWMAKKSVGDRLGAKLEVIGGVWFV
jgi:hypothetical protein